MQTKITDVAAQEMTREFYAAVADGYPLDAALAEARKAIYTQGNDFAWGIPVLYMRTQDGRLFDIRKAERAVANNAARTERRTINTAGTQNALGASARHEAYVPLLRQPDPTEQPTEPHQTRPPKKSVGKPEQRNYRWLMIAAIFLLIGAASLVWWRSYTPTFHPVLLGTIANRSIEGGYRAPPLGVAEFDGVEFDLPPGLNSVTTQAETLPGFPTAVAIDVQIPAPQTVYLLLTGGNIFTQFQGERIGTITLAFRHGEAMVVPLVAGYNIREWKYLDAKTIAITTDTQTREVWSGEAQDQGIGVIDQLTIELPSHYRADELVKITVADESVNLLGMKNPAINLLGITVASR